MDQSRSHPPYVLITPARNEEAFIEKTIEAVTRQTVLPIRWVIVDDGTPDGTAGGRAHGGTRAPRRPGLPPSACTPRSTCTTPFPLATATDAETCGGCA